MDESDEENMGELHETTRPLAPRSFTVEHEETTEDNEQLGEIDEQEDEERNPLLELKKCKEWLQQQKINHEAELLVRKLLVSNTCTRLVSFLQFKKC